MFEIAVMGFSAVNNIVLLIALIKTVNKCNTCGYRAYYNAIAEEREAERKENE